MITFPIGKTLGPGDLSLLVRDESGAPIVPNTIAYTIFGVDAQGNRSLISDPRQSPTMRETGSYYIGLTVPASWGEGTFQVVWHLQQTADTPEGSVTEDFAVMAVRPGTNSLEAPSVLMAARLGVTQKTVEMVMSVRELLADTNPDRNYHFRPPTPGKIVAGFSTRVGYIWEDPTILRFLKLCIAQINMANPKNYFGYTLDTLPDENWAQAAALGAAAKCLTSESARWIADEFGYSLNGVSLTLDKASKYQSLGQQYNEEFKEWIVPLTANRPASVGLRQMAFLR